jgi:hypothetical protein
MDAIDSTPIYKYAAPTSTIHRPKESSKPVAPGFKNKTRYTPHVSPGSQISHIATNKGNIKRQCSIYNVLIVKDITLNSKQRKDNSGL